MTTTEPNAVEAVKAALADLGMQLWGYELGNAARAAVEAIAQLADQRAAETGDLSAEDAVTSAALRSFADLLRAQLPWEGTR